MPEANRSKLPSSEHPSTRRGFIRWALLLFVIIVTGILVWQLQDLLTLDALAAREQQLRSWQTDHAVMAAVAALAIYVVVTGLSIPSGSILTLVCGWFFGFWQGLLLASFGATGGAMLAFFLSRYFFREWFQSRMHERLAKINRALEREGAYYLFTLRLLPMIPFFVVNAVMGLTTIRALTFWWVSQLGMLPGAAAYVYAGSTVPSLQTLADKGLLQIVSWQLLLAFTILGLLPLGLKKLFHALSPTT